MLWEHVFLQFESGLPDVTGFEQVESIYKVQRGESVWVGQMLLFQPVVIASWCNGSITDFDSVGSSSNLGGVTGGLSLIGRAFDCDSKLCRFDPGRSP